MVELTPGDRVTLRRSLHPTAVVDLPAGTEAEVHTVHDDHVGLLVATDTAGLQLAVAAPHRWVRRVRP